MDVKLMMQTESAKSSSPTTTAAAALPLIDLLAAHPEISKHVDRAALRRMLEPVNYLGQSG